MTDHKTVRKALEFAVELCAMRTDFMNKSAIIYGQRMPIEDIKDCLSNALAALDRIEAAASTPKFTEEQWLNLFRTVAARTWTPEQAVEHMKTDVSACVRTDAGGDDPLQKQSKKAEALDAVRRSKCVGKYIHVPVEHMATITKALQPDTGYSHCDKAVPVCYASNPGPQAQAENSCHDCRFAKGCLSDVSDKAVDE